MRKKKELIIIIIMFLIRKKKTHSRNYSKGQWTWHCELWWRVRNNDLIRFRMVVVITRVYIVHHTLGCVTLPIRRRLWTGDDNVPDRRIKFVNARDISSGWLLYSTRDHLVWMMFSQHSRPSGLLYCYYGRPLWSPFSSIKTTHESNEPFFLFGVDHASWSAFYRRVQMNESFLSLRKLI